jgi:hypothetical protein
MQNRTTIAVGLLTLALGASSCRRDATVEQRDRTATPEAARKVDRAADVQRNVNRILPNWTNVWLRLSAITRRSALAAPAERLERLQGFVAKSRAT